MSSDPAPPGGGSAPAPANPDAGAPRGNSTAADVGIGASIAALFLVFRLFAVAHWDWYASEIIVETIDLGDVLPIVLGTLFARPDLTGAVLVVTLPLAVLSFAWPLAGHHRTPAGAALSMILIAATVALVGTTGPWWVLAGAALVAALLATARWVWRRGLAHEVIQVISRRTGLIVVVALLLLAVFVDTPWAPHERIETKDGAKHGYVLRVQPGFVTLLTDQREIEILPTSDILARKIDG